MQPSVGRSVSSPTDPLSDRHSDHSASPSCRALTPPHSHLRPIFFRRTEVPTKLQGHSCSSRLHSLMIAETLRRKTTPANVSTTNKKPFFTSRRNVSNAPHNHLRLGFSKWERDVDQEVGPAKKLEVATLRQVVCGRKGSGRGERSANHFPF